MLSEREELLKSLRAGPMILRKLVRGLDDAALRRRPGESQWAIVEVVGHLGDTEERAIGRLQQMLDQEEPFIPAYDPERLASPRHRPIARRASATRAWPSSRSTSPDRLAGAARAAWRWAR